MNQILATLMFFTRLPWWRIKSVDKDYFRHVVDYWPFVGWLTGGVTAGVLLLGLQFSTLTVAIVLAIISRILLTGALHEDGFADFCDGMGGGNGRQRVLEIMKDSHIGTYGVVGLILYFMLYFHMLHEICLGTIALCIRTQCHAPRMLMFLIVLTADVWSKSCASWLVQQLPYARKEEEAKSKVIYTALHGTSLLAHCIRILIAMIPSAVIALLCFSAQLQAMPANTMLWLAIPALAPLVTEFLLMKWMKSRLQGYTGDCCGATFLICETTFYLAVTCLMA